MHFSGAGLAGCENAVLTEGAVQGARPNQIDDSIGTGDGDAYQVLVLQ